MSALNLVVLKSLVLEDRTDQPSSFPPLSISTPDTLLFLIMNCPFLWHIYKQIYTLIEQNNLKQSLKKPTLPFHIATRLLTSSTS